MAYNTRTTNNEIKAMLALMAAAPFSLAGSATAIAVQSGETEKVPQSGLSTPISCPLHFSTKLLHWK